MNRFLPLSLVCCAALSARAVDPTYTQYLTGVSTVSAAGVPEATGGAWTLTDTDLENENNAVVFDTDSVGVMRLDVTVAPADTNTIARINIEATLEEVSELSGPGAGVQTAFAVYTNAYNAWNGSAWVALSEVPAGVDGTLITNMMVEISYQGASGGSGRKARFTVGNTVLRVRSSDSEWVDLATTSNNIASIGMVGAGTLKTLNASVMLGVASVGDVKYGTLEDAVTAAAAGSTIEVLRSTSEDITLDKDLKIADNGKVSGTITTANSSVAVTIKPTSDLFTTNALAGKSGVYDIPVKVNSGTVYVDLPMANKEVLSATWGSDKLMNVTIQTATSVLTGAKPDGSKALTANTAKLREYLNTHTNEAYIAADVSSASIAAALAATRDNGLPLYQSYALGVPPTTSVKPVPVANDAANDAITLTIPALTTSTKSGDYTISYKVDDNAATANADSIAVPLSSGSHNVKILFN